MAADGHLGCRPTKMAITSQRVCRSTWCLVVGWGFRPNLNFYRRGLHTRTAVVRNPYVSSAFLFILVAYSKKCWTDFNERWLIWRGFGQGSAFLGVLIINNHRLNGRPSSSPVLTATRLSYWSLCDFLYVSPTDLEVTPLNRFWRKMAQAKTFTQKRAFLESKSLIRYFL